MGELLSSGSTLICNHGGKVQAAVPEARVKVMNQPAIAQGETFTVSACPNAPTAGGPCSVASWVVAATRVKINGTFALLVNSQAVAAPTGQVQSVPAQVKVSAI